MPAANTKKSEPLSERVKVQLTVAQREALVRQAEAAGTTLAAYIRQCALASIPAQQPAKRPAVKRHRSQDLAFAELHEIAMQVRKVGTNVNQLAHQANIGVVPITRNEVVYVLERIQVVLSETIAAVERAYR